MKKLRVRNQDSQAILIHSQPLDLIDIKKEILKVVGEYQHHHGRDSSVSRVSLSMRLTFIPSLDATMQGLDV
ncbi:hypothetical protein E2C01_008086 [Portunus trituberculatus]|uniref:Uncharacterized protein n=1 Tax=Portunus trituberculatus TaxID=210409 RepID=A0A5B7D0U4_PORTR|nr:hypothetical protein [Portunus trituberculatus]